MLQASFWQQDRGSQIIDPFSFSVLCCNVSFCPCSIVLFHNLQHSFLPLLYTASILPVPCHFFASYSFSQPAFSLRFSILHSSDFHPWSPHSHPGQTQAEISSTDLALLGVSPLSPLSVLANHFSDFETSSCLYVSSSPDMLVQLPTSL